MDKLFWLPCCLLSWLLACTPAPPTETEVRNRLLGRYCNEDFTLLLEDSTYHNRRRVDSPLGTGLSYESCQGRYRLRLDEGTWYLEVAADLHPRTLFSDCSASYAVWNPDQGYLGGPDSVWVREPYSLTPLAAGDCP